MGTTTQRIIMIGLAINLIMSVIVGIYHEPRILTSTDTIMGDLKDLGENIGIKADDETTNVQPESLQEEGSFGNSIRMGSVLYSIFKVSFAPIPFSDDIYTTAIERIIAMGINLFRIFLLAITIIEIFLVIKNRKAT